MSHLHYVSGEGVSTSRELAFRSASRPILYASYEKAPWTAPKVRYVTNLDSSATAARLFKAQLAQQAWRKSYSKVYAPAYYERVYGSGAYALFA